MRLRAEVALLRRELGILVPRQTAVARGVTQDRFAAVEARVLDRASGTVSLGGRSLALSPKEHAVLAALLRRPGMAVSKEALIEAKTGRRDPVR